MTKQLELQVEKKEVREGRMEDLIAEVLKEGEVVSIELESAR